MNHLIGSMLRLGQLLRRYWSGLVSLAMTFLLISQVTTGLAAPLHQTVPAPTPTPETQPVPTATPVPDNNDDDDDDNNQPPPTNTPAPAATPAPQPTAAPAGLTGSITVQRLNVRQGPGTNFPVIGTVSLGETVTILSRNPVGDWWRACCVSGTNQDGWMAAQFIRPNFDLGQANVLIAVDGALPTPPEPTAVPTIDPSAVPTTTTPSAVAQFELQVQQEPVYAWQGQTITLTYLLNNAGAAVTNVELRNELPAELGFVSAAPLTGGEFLTETAPISRTVVIFRWPELQTGATVSASVQVSVSTQLLNGTVLDNLAVAGADNVQPVTAGITIGMPPTTLPDFR